ncbi:dihydroneopterin aldolase [Campylobacter sp. US33a]|uniref:Dihydroneopterin aldolase n=1 Tax=Campylobacter sp. CCS1377 TaxID=3158229 RepID=A0AAU7E7L4_9BACT|nr:dihydroneopterin aldolase [Campylobacter sp. US33a]MCW1361014.1 dihydroneopterin aldolase [Campylobacter jejuni]TEY02025.1 dihydroneopterin aldolase [Campylobacter sp. US33a]
MEFLELLLILIAIILMIAKPEKEKFAFSLIVIAWCIMVFDYLGRKSGAILGLMNL